MSLGESLDIDETSLRFEVSYLLGDERSGMIGDVEELLKRMQAKPELNVGSALSLLDMYGEDMYVLPDEERQRRMDINRQALDRLYSLYGVVESDAESTADSWGLFVEVTHTTAQGFHFREMVGFHPPNESSGDAPEEFCVMIEAIRDPGSDQIHFR
jgi:hypothetical protein